uniref:Vesicle-associated membrane protein 722-like n=1 Tax=Tanacetum cinerariifolium TaxID=118510 RepID=A0A6L2J5D0_TANCI|nr:vesicle-associated membrane protein 722-like [Tanacetum cinerariifolium]
MATMADNISKLLASQLAFNTQLNIIFKTQAIELELTSALISNIAQTLRQNTNTPTVTTPPLKTTTKIDNDAHLSPTVTQIPMIEDDIATKTQTLIPMFPSMHPNLAYISLKLQHDISIFYPPTLYKSYDTARFIEEKLATTQVSFVSRGTVILAEYTEFTDGFTYCVVAAESAGRQVPMAFLERTKDDFSKKYGGGKANTAAANSLNKEFGPKLKEQMQYCVDHPEEISKLSKVKAQVSEVKGVMMENIEKVLDRGEKIELLVDKTENLRSQDNKGWGVIEKKGTDEPILNNS